MIFGKYINRYYRKYWYLFLAVFLIDSAVDIVQLLLPLVIGNVISVFASDSLGRLRPVIRDGKVVYLSDVNCDPLRIFFGFKNGFTIDSASNLPFYQTDFFLTLITLIVIGLIIVVGRMGWRFFSAKIGAKIELDMRQDMFRHIQTQSLAYYSTKKVGGLLSYFTQDLSTIKQCFTEGLIFTTDLVVLGSLSFTLMALMAWKVTLITAIPLVLFIIFGGVVGKGEAVRYKISDDAFEHLSDYTEENLQGFNVIKAFRKERDKVRSFQSLAEEARVTSVKYLRFSAAIDSGINILLSVTFAILYFLAAYIIINNDASLGGNLKDVGKLTTYIGYYDALIWPMIAGGLLIDYASRGSGARKRIATILDAAPDIVDGDNPETNQLLGDVEFNHLSFSYPDGDVASLKDITLHVTPGMTVGVIGRTGSGKSTLVSLLPKLYNLPRAMLFIDGKDINDWRKDDLRKRIGYVLQEGFLFSGTIKDNIAFSEKEPGVVDMDKVIAAAKFANIEHDIEGFEKKYDTIVGEKGATLSGGQRQRVSIARAIYKNPSMLILDDSLSAVDADTEKEILKNIRSSTKKLTTFVIAHRVSAIEDADLILVLDQGHLTGIGTHDELYRSCMLYHDICELQRLEKEVS